jgi:hypothetical protein
MVCSGVWPLKLHGPRGLSSILPRPPSASVIDFPLRSPDFSSARARTFAAS